MEKMSYIYILLLIVIAVNLYVRRKNIVELQNKLIGNGKPAFSNEMRIIQIITIVLSLIGLVIFYILLNLGDFSFRLF